MSSRAPTSKKSIKSRRTRSAGELPTRDEIIEFVSTTQQRASKREIAKAFNIKGADRVALKALLADMTDEGLLAGKKKDLRAAGVLPTVTVLDIVGTDADGELIAEPAQWDDGVRPRGLMISSGRVADSASRRGSSGRDTALGEGDRVLARITPIPDEDRDPPEISFTAQPMKRIGRDRKRMLGIFRQAHHGGGLISPVDKKARDEWHVRREDCGDASDGDLVRFDVVSAGRAAQPQARVADVLGNPSDQRQISLIAVHAHGIPDQFPSEVMAEVDDLPQLERSGRRDLTGLNLVTIDPPDARDHDDAVHAEPDTAADNPDGFIVTVAIADVAAYVRAGTRLDREARKRGNSCYFPDRVVPMLPELISNDLCSLREKELRPCLAVRMRFSKTGAKHDHTFSRGMMRSAAKLSYGEAQEAFDRIALGRDMPGLDEVLSPLWQAYVAVRAARKQRAPLDLDLPERKIILDETGHVSDIVVPDRLDAHKLIEEFMIQANVAAAETLERAKLPCVYRVHDAPSKEKLKGLRDFLETLGMKLPAQNVLKPGDINRILEKAKSLPVPELVSEVVLRSQSQAEYALENLGHFGLNLSRYAHFTSPIRRYADLLVHRALITALKLGDDGLDMREVDGLPEVATAISQTERRSMTAERETTDRLVAAFLSEKIGAKFRGRVSGVVRFGLFVRLDDTGADGFVPAGSLGGAGWYEHDEEQHALIDRDSHRGYRLGDAVTVKLLEAIPVAGALRFEVLSEPNKMQLALTKGYRGSRAPRLGRGRRNRGRGR
ncbi:MAG: ribonuclease R [Pseudomonadota bacterium]